MNREELVAETEKGKFVATVSPDIEYPGINVEFIPNKDDQEENISLPGVRLEFDNNGKLRVLVWADKDREDYSNVIYVNHII